MNTPNMVRLTDKDSWARLVSHAQLIHGTPERPKVCRTPDGFIMKWFYPKGGFSTDRIMPYAKRFIKNSQQLEQKGIETVHINAWLFDPETQAHIVIYPALDGMTVRDAMQTECAGFVMDGFVDYVVELHQRGIFFRGIHLGNVLVCEAEVQPPAPNHADDRDLPPALTFSLIDIADCKVKSQPLNRWERIRNIKHLFNNLEDKPLIAAYGMQCFVERYMELTGVEIQIAGVERAAEMA